jgi:DNA primase
MYYDYRELRRNIRNNLSFQYLLYELGIRVYPGNKIFTIYKKESKPSLSIDVKNNLFHCFATGKGGDIVKFYMDYKQVGFKQAIEELCDYGQCQTHLLENNEIQVELPNPTKQKPVDKKTLKKNDKTRANVYKYLIDDLLKARLARDVKKYLFGSRRKLKLSTIKIFKIRAVDDMDELKSKLLLKFSVEDLIIAGLLNDKNNFIFFYNKIIIPYRADGKINYLRFHHMPDNKKSYCKYIGLKGMTARRIFNVDVLKRLRKGDELYLCEGEFDTMIAEQAGFNAIGFPGVTNIPFEELKALKIDQYNLHVAFDSDEAGKKAVQKLANELNISLERINLHTGKDLTEVYNG